MDKNGGKKSSQMQSPFHNSRKQIPLLLHTNSQGLQTLLSKEAILTPVKTSNERQTRHTNFQKRGVRSREKFKD
jgi:hypothetical protein